MEVVRRQSADLDVLPEQHRRDNGGERHAEVQPPIGRRHESERAPVAALSEPEGERQGDQRPFPNQGETVPIAPRIRNAVGRLPLETAIEVSAADGGDDDGEEYRERDIEHAWHGLRRLLFNTY